MKRTFLISILLSIVLLVCSRAQEIPAIDDIVKKIENNCLPPIGYSVDIVQSIIASDKGISMTADRQTTFNATYNPKTGLYLNEMGKNNKNITESNVNQQADTQASVKIVVDLYKLFKDLSSWQNVQIITGNLDNQTYYKIIAQYNSFDFKIWVNASDFYVYKIVLRIKGQEFSETNIKYKRVKNTYWLPSEITINQAPNNTQVTQQFGTYQFQ